MNWDWNPGILDSRNLTRATHLTPIQLPTRQGRKKEEDHSVHQASACSDPALCTPRFLVVVFKGIEALRGATQQSEGHRFLGKRKPRPTEGPYEVLPL